MVYPVQTQKPCVKDGRNFISMKRVKMPICQPSVPQFRVLTQKLDFLFFTWNFKNFLIEIFKPKMEWLKVRLYQAVGMYMFNFFTILWYKLVDNFFFLFAKSLRDS